MFSTTPAPAASPHIFDATEANFEADVIQASLQQPVLVDFWADWCAPCKALTPVLEKIVGEYNGALKLAKVDVDAQQQLAAAVGVKSLPTVVLVREGRVVDGFNGALPESAVREFLAPHVQPAEATDVAELNEPDSAEVESPEQTVERLQKAVIAAPDKHDLKLDLAAAYLRTGNATAAETLIDALPANLAEDDRAKRVRAHVELARDMQDAPSADELRERVAKDPSDFVARDQLGVRLLLDGDQESALDAFLENLRSGRSWNDGQAKKHLIAAFMLIDDADLVGRYRRKMSALLF